MKNPPQVISDAVAVPGRPRQDRAPSGGRAATPQAGGQS
jgi:hypothetical protein